MRFHFFTVEAFTPACGEAELNAFCAQHRIASVDKQFIDQGAQSYWLFCLTSVNGDGAERSPSGGKRARVDYREVLSELFTNEQLAEMVTRRATTITASRRQKADALRQAGRHPAERLPKRHLDGLS